MFCCSLQRASVSADTSQPIGGASAQGVCSDLLCRFLLFLLMCLNTCMTNAPLGMVLSDCWGASLGHASAHKEEKKSLRPSLITGSPEVAIRVMNIGHIQCETKCPTHRGQQSPRLRELSLFLSNAPKCSVLLFAGDQYCLGV